MNIDPRTFAFDVNPGQATKAQAVPEGWKPLNDVQWMNIVNHDHAYHSFTKDEAVHEAVKLTEAKLKELNASHTTQEVTQPTYWNAQRAMIERTIIGLRDGWATRKDAADALTTLAAAPVSQTTKAQAVPMTDQQVADFLFDGDIITKLGHRALINGDDVAVTLDLLTKIANKILAAAPEAPVGYLRKAETAEQANVLPPTRGTDSQHDAGEQVLTDDDILDLLMFVDPAQYGLPTGPEFMGYDLKCARIIEAELARRCRAQRTNKNDNSSVIAPTTSTVSAPDELEQAARLCEEMYESGEGGAGTREAAKRIRALRTNPATPASKGEA